MSHDPHAPDTPTPDPVEERLRAALRAEADRHPVTPDLAGLRDRTDGAVIDLRLAPRRNRARLVAAAAVVALVLAATGVVVAIQTDEDGGEPVLTDQPPPTGYYLPGPGWEVQEVFVVPAPALPGNVRSVHYVNPGSAGGDVDGEPLLGAVTVEQFAIDDGELDLVALFEGSHLADPRQVTQGEGDDARVYAVSGLRVDGTVDPGEIATEVGSLAAERDGQVLFVDWYGTRGEDAAVALADRWWTSGGDEIALDPATGLVRDSDVTYRDVEPVPIDEVLRPARMDADEAEAFYDEHHADALVQVIVTVEGPDGWVGAYSLRAPGRSVTTGAGAADGGAAAGLGPEEVGAPLPSAAGGPHPAWESGLGIFAEVPGATIGVPLVSVVAEVVTPERARELWAALAPVSREAWVAAQPEGGYVPEDAWAETLPATRARLDEWFAEEDGDDGSDAIEMPEPFSLEARDGVNPAAGRSPEEVDRLVADALLAFVGGGGPVDADLFAPAVTFWSPLNPGQGGPVAIEDVAAAVPAEARGDEITPAIEAWTMLTTVGHRPRAEPVGEVAGCGGLEEEAADPAVVVILKPLPAEDGSACGPWNALVVTLDDQQRIAEVEARSGP